MDRERVAAAERRAAARRLAMTERLAAFPDRLAAAARRVQAAEPLGPPAGEWSAREIVAHLVAAESAVWQSRLDQLGTGGQEPAWAWTEPGPVADPSAAWLEGALGLFSASRAATVARITALGDAGWARTGVHATYGRLDVLALLGVAADHDDEHLATLETRAGTTP